MSEHRPEDRLIEQILQTLCGAQCDDPEGGAAQMAESFVRFMDEMPGGFLIYRAGQGEEIIYANQALLRIFQCATMEEFMAHTGGSFQIGRAHV